MVQFDPSAVYNVPVCSQKIFERDFNEYFIFDPNKNTKKSNLIEKRISVFVSISLISTQIHYRFI